MLRTLKSTQGTNPAIQEVPKDHTLQGFRFIVRSNPKSSILLNLQSATHAPSHKPGIMEAEADTKLWESTTHTWNPGEWRTISDFLSVWIRNASAPAGFEIASSSKQCFRAAKPLRGITEPLQLIETPPRWPGNPSPGKTKGTQHTGAPGTPELLAHHTPCTHLNWNSRKALLFQAARILLSWSGWPGSLEEESFYSPPVCHSCPQPGTTGLVRVIPNFRVEGSQQTWSPRERRCISDVPVQKDYDPPALMDSDFKRIRGVFQSYKATEGCHSATAAR